MTVLRTARLVLRPKSPADADAIHAIVSDWEVVRWTASWPWPAERALTEERLGQPQPENGLIVSILRDGTVIGMAGVHDAELGYMLAPSAWGQGYATEACAALLDFAFASTDWPEVAAGVFEGNPASVRVLSRLGFARVGESTHACRSRGRDMPTVDFLLARRAWAERGAP